MELLPRGNERNNISFFVVSEDKEDKEKRLSLVVTPKALFVEIVLVLFAFVIEEAKEIAETLLLMRKDIVTQSSSREGKKVTHFLRTFLTQNNAKVFALLSLESIRLKLERKRRRGETRRESRFFLRGRSKKTDDDA